MKILYFTAAWCVPCKKMRPIVDSLNFDGIFDIVDVEARYEMVKQYDVVSVPTFIGLNSDGQEVLRKTGAMPLDQIQAMITEVIA